MRIAFLGTPAVAVPALQALDDADDIDVVAVVTNPDRPKGRSGTPVAPPVKQEARIRDIPALQPRRPIEIVDDLREMDLDVAAVVAYGAILPTEVLETTHHGFVNLHYSLLPRWRGAAPVQHAIRAGDMFTGVTTFVLDEGMDTGSILDQVEIGIGDHETAGELLDRLTELGAPVLVKSVRRLAAGEQPVPQPRGGATLAPKIERDDVRIDWSEPARRVVDLVRSVNPRPGAHTTFRDAPLKVWRARLVDTGTGGPGEIVDHADDGPVVATGDRAVVLTELQPAGKAAMAGRDFLNGYQPDRGEMLGRPGGD